MSMLGFEEVDVRKECSRDSSRYTAAMVSGCHAIGPIQAYLKPRYRELQRGRSFRVQGLGRRRRCRAGSCGRTGLQLAPNPPWVLTCHIWVRVVDGRGRFTAMLYTVAWLKASGGQLTRFGSRPGTSEFIRGPRPPSGHIPHPRILSRLIQPCVQPFSPPWHSPPPSRSRPLAFPACRPAPATASTTLTAAAAR